MSAHRVKGYALFDLKTDFNEEHNLMAGIEHRQRAKDLILRLKRLANEDRLKLKVSIKPPKLSREEIEKLKSLGYTHR